MDKWPYSALALTNKQGCIISGHTTPENKHNRKPNKLNSELHEQIESNLMDINVIATKVEMLIC